jgi:cAMP phosphodiesterase
LYLTIAGKFDVLGKDDLNHQFAAIVLEINIPNLSHDEAVHGNLCARIQAADILKFGIEYLRCGKYGRGLQIAVTHYEEEYTAQGDDSCF